MLDGESAPTASVATQVVERLHGIPSGTNTGSARIVATATTGAGRSAGNAPTKAAKASFKGHGYSGKSSRSSKGSKPLGAQGMEGDVTMKPLDVRERRQSILQATEQVMQALRAVPHDPAVAQLLETKQCEAEQT